MRVIRLLALRRLRLQPTRALLAAIVVGAGTSLAVTIVVIMGSLTQTVEDAGRALAGPAPLRVAGSVQKGGISPDMVDTVAGHPDVDAAVPIIQGVVLVDPDPSDPDDDVPTMALGFDCRAEAILGSFDCDPAALAAIDVPLVGAGLLDAVGRGADVRTTLGRHPLSAAVEIDQVEDLNGGRVVVFPLATAQQELGRGDGVDLIYVLPRDGVAIPELKADLQELLGDGPVVLDALDAPPTLGAVVGDFIPLFTIVALLALGIGGVLVRNSVTLSLEERRRQTAIVGALGGSRSILVWGTVVEVVVLGAVGGLIGVAAGAGLAGPVSGALDEVLREIAGIPLKITIPPNAVVVGVLLGVVVALLAAIGPARRAVRIDVAAELASRGRREEAATAGSIWRLLAALGAMGAGLAMAYLSAHEAGIDQSRATLAPVGFLVSAGASVAFVASAAPRILRLAERRLRFRRATTRLAISNLRREPRRTAVMAIAIGFAMGVGFVTSSFKMSVTQAITDSLNGNLEGVQVSSIDPNNSALSEARLGPDVLRRLSALPGVASVERSAFVVLGNEAGDLIGVQAFTEVWDGLDVATGQYSEAGLDAGRVTIGPALARAEGLRPGDDVTLSTPNGKVDLPVMAVMFDGSFGGRNVNMSYDLMLELYGEQQPVSVVANPEPGVSEAELIRTIEGADLDPRLIVEGHQQVIDRNAKEVSSQLSTFDAIQRGLLAMSFVAVLSTLLLVGIQRRKEFGMLAAVGMTPSELRRMILVEAGVAALIGVFVTGSAAIVQYACLNAIVPVIIGWKDPFVLDGSAWVRYGAVAIVTALVAALYPSRRAGKVEVLEALRYE